MCWNVRVILHREKKCKHFKNYCAQVAIKYNRVYTTNKCVRSHVTNLQRSSRMCAGIWNPEPDGVFGADAMNHPGSSSFKICKMKKMTLCGNFVVESEC